MHNATEYNERFSISPFLFRILYITQKESLYLKEKSSSAYSHEHGAILLNHLKTASLGTHPQTKTTEEITSFIWTTYNRQINPGKHSA